MTIEHSRCLGVSSAVGGWLLPLRPRWPVATADGAEANASDACDPALWRRNPLELLRDAEDGFRALREAARTVEAPAANDEGTTAAPRLLDTEQLAWFWHSWHLLQEASGRNLELDH